MVNFLMTRKLGIMADTHNQLPPSLAAVFAGVELILHAGDVMDGATLERITAIAPVRAVRGNNDGGLPPEVPDHDLVEFHGLRIGLTHGHLFPWGARGREQMVRRFQAMRPDLIVCGHTHCYGDEMVAGTRVLNPGTAGMRWFGGRPTAVVLRLDGKVYDIERVEL